MSNPASLKPFQKGDDPRRNMNGRPVGSRNFKTVLMEALEKEVNVGKDKKKLDELLADKIVKMALDGDQRIIKLIWEYRDGKPPKYKGDENTEPHKRKGLRNDYAELDRVMKLFAPKDKPAQS